MMLLYSDRQLNKAYRIYAKHQGIHGVPFISIDNFRKMFEEQQTALYKQQMDDIHRMLDDPNNRFDS